MEIGTYKFISKYLYSISLLNRNVCLFSETRFIHPVIFQNDIINSCGISAPEVIMLSTVCEFTRLILSNSYR